MLVGLDSSSDHDGAAGGADRSSLGQPNVTLFVQTGRNGQGCIGATVTLSLDNRVKGSIESPFLDTRVGPVDEHRGKGPSYEHPSSKRRGDQMV